MTSKPARWGLLAVGVAGLLYGASLLAVWETGTTQPVPNAQGQARADNGPAYQPWPGTPQPTGAATLRADGTANAVVLGEPLGPQLDEVQRRSVATVASAPLRVGPGATATPVPADVIVVDPTDPPPAPVDPTNTAAPPPTSTAPPPATNTAPPPIVAPPTVALPTSVAPTHLPQPTNTPPPVIVLPPIVLPTLPFPLPLPLPTIVLPPLPLP